MTSIVEAEFTELLKKVRLKKKGLSWRRVNVPVTAVVWLERSPFNPKRGFGSRMLVVGYCVRQSQDDPLLTGSQLRARFSVPLLVAARSAPGLEHLMKRWREATGRAHSDYQERRFVMEVLDDQIDVPEALRREAIAFIVNSYVLPILPDDGEITTLLALQDKGLLNPFEFDLRSYEFYVPEALRHDLPT